MKISPHLECTINLPAAIRDPKDDTVHALPPYARAKTYLVDKYPAAPAAWPRGDAKSAAYFVAVKEGQGMWLDFNACREHTHDVAVLLSIQGVNPLTGAKIEGFGLEQYKTKCPVHGVAFQSHRHCPDCGFAWPEQNYLATTGTPEGVFWLDGFRAPDGKVRQYVFTAEEARGVAAQLIGQERSFSIGIAFYLSKAPKPPRPPIRATYFGGSLDLDSTKYMSFLKQSGSSSTMDYSAGPTSHVEHGRGLFASRKSRMQVNSSRGDSLEMRSSVSADFHEPVEEAFLEDRMEVSAGSQIHQDVYPDPKGLDYWQAEPAGILYVQYASAADVAKILAGGVRATKADGFMSGLKVGSK
jgi:hypothetical protein